MRNGSLTFEIMVATVAAGPIFILVWAMLEWVMKPVQGWQAAPMFFTSLFALSPLVIIVGAIFAILPNMLGSLLMAGLADHFAPARSRIAWATAGGIVGWLIEVVLDGVRQDNAVLAITGICCALICRQSVSWADDEELPCRWARAW